MTPDEMRIHDLLTLWAKRTRDGDQDHILANHHPDVVIYDVLPPLQYNGTKAYRNSWDDWQPQTTGENIFELEGLQVIASGDIGYAFGLLRCGGTTPGGETFRDVIRATFCLRKTAGNWLICHQHSSMPRG